MTDSEIGHEAWLLRVIAKQCEPRAWISRRLDALAAEQCDRKARLGPQETREGAGRVGW